MRALELKPPTGLFIFLDGGGHCLARRCIKSNHKGLSRSTRLIFNPGFSHGLLGLYNYSPLCCADDGGFGTDYNGV